ncbi:unnamed protein product [Medioppia subpectinata]|uniref:RING-type domain-containing protein n=1 Tax=Medioppia subpectinata TaxID=1979941 RepID=A0A7R9KNV4_9ACAR|nr:unnamed protein product [Medioppia subpectinata]CAG2106025.1 unnamed protein product [Medioppia subpectinata]
MPGYSSDRFPELSDHDRDDYTCSICQEIFNTPVTTTCCRQTFCEDCITDWLKTNTTCPYDRKPLTLSGLSQPPRAMMNTLGRFKIQCDHWAHGCRDIIKLEDLSQHTVNCRYKLAKCETCQCDQTPVHDCIVALLVENSELKMKLAGQLQVNKAAYYMNKLNTEAHVEGSGGQCGQASGQDSIAELQLFKRQAMIEIEALKQANEELKNNTLTMVNLKARLKNKTIDRTIDIVVEDMKPNMVEMVRDITFDAIDRSDTINEMAANIKSQMKAKCHHRKWHCFVSAGRNSGSILSFEPSRQRLEAIQILANSRVFADSLGCESLNQSNTS